MADIIETSELPESEFPSELAATEESHPEEKIEFHVQMRGYTQREMDSFIVEAAARHIVGRSSQTAMAKDIESKCALLIAEKADKALSAITNEILDQPMTPGFGDKKPVTMREFLGLYGREYLTQRVGSDGKPATSNYSSEPRIERIVAAAMDAKFKSEITAATNAVVNEVRAELKARHNAILEAEKARFRLALDALAPVSA